MCVVRLHVGPGGVRGPYSASRVTAAARRVRGSLLSCQGWLTPQGGARDPLSAARVTRPSGGVGRGSILFFCGYRTPLLCPFPPILFPIWEGLGRPPGGVHLGIPGIWLLFPPWCHGMPSSRGCFGTIGGAAINFAACPTGRWEMGTCRGAKNWLWHLFYCTARTWGAGRDLVCPS